MKAPSQTSGAAPPAKPPRAHPKIAKTLAIAGLAAAMVFGFLFAAILYARRHAEPIVRERIVQTLEDRLHANVELDQVHVSVVTGNVQVGGAGLRIVSISGHPLLAAKSFEFATGLHEIFSRKSALVKVRAQGLDIHIPAGAERERATAPLRSSFRNPSQGIFSVVEVIATDSTLSIDRLDPAKPPLVFQIGKLRFSQSVPGEPFVYDATLINPKPVGTIHSTGRFGPWNSGLPRATPIDGAFTFTDADLSTIAGIHGHLQGQGSITGTLGEITSDGTTHTPDFGIDPGTAGVPLDTTFHAVVDGTSGDVNLQPVRARLLHTDILATGKVVKVPDRGDGKPHGHDITLATDIHGRVEDILTLIAKPGKPPLLRAALTDNGHLHIPPGKQRVLLKLDIAGRATLSGITWSDPETQQKVDSLSMRAQGEAGKLAALHAQDQQHSAPLVTSNIQTQFHLDRGTLALSGVDYTMPGATVTMDGTFNIPADSLDFHGHVRTQASPSQMITGWKSLLLKPFDPLFKRNGAGLQLPISLTGPATKPHIGIDLGHHDSTPAPKSPPK
jgi:hypothetical protein